MICAAVFAVEFNKTKQNSVSLPSESTCVLELTPWSPTPWGYHSFHFSLYLIYYQSLSLLDISHQHTNMFSISQIFTSSFDATSLSGYNSIPLLPFTGKLKRIVSTHTLHFLTSHSLTCSLLVNIRDDLHLAKSNEDFTILSFNPQQYRTCLVTAFCIFPWLPRQHIPVFPLPSVATLSQAIFLNPSSPPTF